MCVEYLLPYVFGFSWDETFAVFTVWKPCVNILGSQKIRLSSCTMMKMAVKRTGVMKTALPSLLSLTTFIHKHTKFRSIKGLNERRIKGGSVKIETTKLLKIGDP